jgi:sialidase-1
MMDKLPIVKRVIFCCFVLLVLNSFLTIKQYYSDYQSHRKKHSSAISAKGPVHIDVFVSGSEGYHTYRIPSVLTTTSGIILAFAEGRASKSDHAENDIVLKRSLDGGNVWSKLEVIAEDGENCLNNPTAVQIRKTGRIILMYQRYFKDFDEHGAEPGYVGEKVCRTYIIYSDDDGVTWSESKEITRNVKREKVVTSTATGPGVGIQIVNGKHKGRIIMPFNQGPYGNWKVYMAYSDDLGESWEYGEVAPENSKGLGNEVQVVELQNGSLMLNSRSAYGNKLRKSALSHDGGETWSGLIDENELIEPQCMGSILRFSFVDRGNKNRILFSNPASKDKRELGTVRLSYDEGITWPVSKIIYTGFFAYSCLTKINDDTIGLLYEKDNYEKITFAIIELAWLESNK